MRALPDGVLTLVFSDVEGSTRLAQGLGDQVWADCLEVHRKVLARAFASHGGTVVDVEGDGFFVVFRRPTDAVLAAIEGQLALARQPWPSNCSILVRMGVHTGEALLRGKHYVGQEVHRASRICTAAHGGQIVLSQATFELVHNSMPDGVAFFDLGEHRLKDLDDPQRLFQLRAPLLRPDFPRLRTQPPAHIAEDYDAPLPEDAFVIEPGPDVPEALRPFAGKWSGTMCIASAHQQHKLVIERIEPTIAWAVWSVGLVSTGDGEAVWFRQPAAVRNGMLSMLINDAVMNYRLKSTNEIEVDGQRWGYPHMNHLSGVLKRENMPTKAFTQEEPTTYWPMGIDTLQVRESTSENHAVFPSTMFIDSRAPGVAPERTKWLGKWSGWASRGCTCDVKLAVLSVTNEEARIIQLWAATGVDADPTIRSAKFVGDELVMRVDRLRIAYRMRPTGEVELVRFNPDGLVIWGVMGKIE